METLKENIIKKYQRATKKYIKNELLKKGYIKTPENEILKLNPFKIEFELIDIPTIINIINIYVPNFWNIAPEKQINIILNNFLELLPMATENELNNYINYIRTNKTIMNEKQLKKDKDRLIKENEKRHKPVFKGGVNSPEYQSQALINENIFYDNGNYFIYDKETDLFKPLTNGNIAYYLLKHYKNLNCTPIDINDYMKTSYLFFVTNSDIPNKYNANKEKIKIVSELKNDFEKVNKIIKTFE